LFGASCYSCISILSSLLLLGLIYNSLSLMCTISQPLCQRLLILLMSIVTFRSFCEKALVLLSLYKCLAFKGYTRRYGFVSPCCNSLYWWIKWFASFGWRWQDLCLLNKQRHKAFHTAKHYIHGTRMPNIDNDNSTRAYLVTLKMLQNI
jgi:hypothetical protein